MVTVDAATFECPHCHCQTTSLKEYPFLKKWIFLFLIHIEEVTWVRGCPGCVRNETWVKAFRLIPTANFSWPFFVVPWALLITFGSFVPGHSSAIQNAACPDPPFQHKLLAVLSPLLFAFLPIVGLFLCWNVYKLTRQYNVNWRGYGGAGMVLSVFVNGLWAIVAIFLPLFLEHIGT